MEIVMHMLPKCGIDRTNTLSLNIYDEVCAYDVVNSYEV